jgi:hypothetical protein
VYAWVGSKASATEKRNALSFAAQYLKQENRPPQTPVRGRCHFFASSDPVGFLPLQIVKVFEGGENEYFNAQFD